MPVADYTPTTADVAKVIRGRVRTRLGAEAADFSDQTTVAQDTVQGLITDAVDEMASVIGPDVPDGADPDDPDTLRRMAKRTTTYLAAAEVELSLEPEQAGQKGSAYDKLMIRHKDMRKTLIEAIAETGEGGAGESIAGAGELSSYGFPDANDWDSRRF